MKLNKSYKVFILLSIFASLFWEIDARRPGAGGRRRRVNPVTQNGRVCRHRRCVTTKVTGTPPTRGAKQGIACNGNVCRRIVVRPVTTAKPAQSLVPVQPQPVNRSTGTGRNTGGYRNYPGRGGRYRRGYYV